MKKILTLLALLYFSTAQAEPIVSTRNILDNDARYKLTVTTLDCTSGVPVQMNSLAMEFTNWSPGNASTAVTFPPSPTNYLYCGVRAWLTLTGTGVLQATPLILDLPQTAKLVPAGLQLSAIYLAPLSGLGDLTLTIVPDTTPPTAPSSLVATVSGTATINLGWVAATDSVGVTGYGVERCIGVGCTVFLMLANGTATSYTDNGLAPGTMYSYRVAANDAAGNKSAYSNVAAAVTQVPPPPPPPAPSGASPDGTRIPAVDGKCDSTTITEASGVTWFNRPFVGDGKAGQCAIDRAPTLTGTKTQQRGSVNYLLIKGGVVYNFDNLSGNCPAPFWERWSGTSWACSGSAP